jgi:hypothetical protein
MICFQCFISKYLKPRAKLSKKNRSNGFFFENISYFCIVKHLEKVFKIFLWGIIMLTVSGITPITAQNKPQDLSGTKVTEIDPMDSIEVSLLICSPHEEIYSLYGHAAIRWHDLRKRNAEEGERDWVFNWGMFNFNKPYFELRFLFGLTDYELGCYSYSHFWPYYKKWGSSITEQVLNLNNDEKRRLEAILQENLRPENKVYRYNYFYDNCSTRPRDVIEASIDGQVQYLEREDYHPTYREMVRECVRNHPWARFGIDMLLGIKADFKTNREEQEFLPMNLLQDIATVQIYANGEYRQLVKEQRTLVAPGVQMIEPDFPLTPTQVAILVLMLSVGILWIEWRRKKTFKYWDMLLMSIQGLSGCILTVMLFSQHPTTTLNLNVLLFNPLPLFFLPAVFRRKADRWWIIQFVMLVLFAVGAFFQSYAEGMGFLALSLLLRIISNKRGQLF